MHEYNIFYLCFAALSAKDSKHSLAAAAWNLLLFISGWVPEMKEEKLMLYREDPQRRQMGMHVSREHLRFMDQHLMGSGYYPSLPLSFPRKKKDYIAPREEWADGYECSHVFDGDGIHSLANTENKIPEIPKPPVCVGAGGSVHVIQGGMVAWEFHVRKDLKQSPHIRRAEFGDMQEANHQNSTGRIWFQIEAVCIFKLTLVLVHPAVEKVQLIYMWRDKCG